MLEEKSDEMQRVGYEYIDRYCKQTVIENGAIVERTLLPQRDLIKKLHRWEK